ncbi:MAG: ATP-dependent helicase, partial [Clostridium sp.]
MSLQFIIGSSGAGKTRRLYEDLIGQSIHSPEERFFAIVPEQFTMQTQKDIVMLHPNHGVMNIDIVSFERLAYRIFEECSVERISVLDDMGKSMVLRKVAAEKKKELKLFGSHLEKVGFIGELKS